MHAEDVHDPPTNGVYTLNQLRAAIPLLSQCVQEVVDVYSELPEEERSLGEFALRASDFLEDGLLLDVLLAVLRPHKVLAETMDSTFGLSISGSSQRLKTRIRVNCLRFKAISLEEEDYLQVLRYLQSRLKQGGVGVEDADEDATQPFAMIDRFPPGIKLPGVKEYATKINDEHRRVRQENAALAKRVEDLETQLIEHSQLRKALSAKSARASRKRKSGADGGFTNEVQKRRAVTQAVEVLSKIADTDLKMDGVMDGVRKEMGLEKSDNAHAAKVLICDQLMEQLELFRNILARPDAAEILGGNIDNLRRHYNYLLGAVAPSTAAPRGSTLAQ
ncbi:hypothetical protein B484DRAFT_463561, partial [Ochromonadaceae sp. CCMP2298]